MIKYNFGIRTVFPRSLKNWRPEKFRIYQWMRQLTVNRRIFGGFLFLVMMFAMTVLFVLWNNHLLVKRVKQVTNVDTKADRLLLLSSKRIESSRVNLMRFRQNLIPSVQESLNDVTQAAQLLAEAEKLLIAQGQNVAVKQVIEILTKYQSLIQQIGIQRGGGGDIEMNRMGFVALKTGSDIGFQIEDIVEKNEARVADENRMADTRLNTNLRLLMVFAVGALIFSLILASFVGRSITVPISELKESAESFQQGHTDFPLAVTGTDELSILALTFKEMAANLNQNKIILQERADALEEELLQRRQAETELQNYKANLEDLVKNRTSELSKAVDRLNDEISERNKTEEALKKSENRVQAIFSAINTGIIIIDPETRIIVDVNPISAQMIGLPRESIIGNMCHKFICPKEMNNCPVLDHDQKINNAERILVTALGEQIPILKTVTSVNLGGKTHLLESIIDISEQKKIENAIRENEEKVSVFFNSTNDGLLVLSPEKGFMHANAAAVEMLGFETLADLLLCGPAEISPEFQPDGRNTAAAVKEHIAAAIRLGAAYRFEWMHKRCDGSPLPSEVILIPIMLAGIPQLLFSIRDITERKQAEKELRGRMEELERFSRLTINREKMMIQLKEEINTLLVQAGQEKKYKIVEASQTNS